VRLAILAALNEHRNVRSEKSDGTETAIQKKEKPARN
jgi:hypothetical protein